MKTVRPAVKLPGKLIACVLIAACVVLGALGLVLPIIPGLLFLALAALLAAKHFPWLDERLRRHRALRRHLDDADRFIGLKFAAKLRMAGWLGLKVIAGSLAAMSALVIKRRR
ncbi:MAG TPA: DUF454 family protein, partial [Gammaproteobacteria bacterium]|nr:DUF454 family protein [Gammaproteobacteria bacterium]